MFEVEMYLPYPSTALKFDSFSPLNTSSVVSICSAKVKSIGDNFKCGLDESAISKTMYQDSNGLGNNIGHLDIGTVINKGKKVVLDINLVIQIKIDIGILCKMNERYTLTYIFG